MNAFIFDLETTGLNPYHDSIIEIAIKKFNEDISYETFVKPTTLYDGKFVPKLITDITKITHEDIANNGISQFMACQYFFKFLSKNTDKEGNIYLIAHNGISFDMIFICNLLKNFVNSSPKEKSIKYINIYNRIKCIDTLFLSKYLLPNRGSYTQSSLCHTYSIHQENPHRAKGDVEDLEKLYIKLLEIINTDNHDQVYCLLNTL
jgi:DNA polymerase III subunit alpha, Gram-positive type